MKKTFLIILSLIFFIINIFPQDDIIGAKSLMEKLSETVKKNVKDYKADVKWMNGDAVSSGKLYFKNPQKVKIEYKDPAGQVFCTNGYELWIHIPSMSATLHQNILDKEKKRNEDGTVETVKNPIFLSPVGYDKLLSEYAIEYHETKEKVVYKDTKVYKFKLLRWKSARNGINTIYLMIDENGMIRQAKAITANFRQISIEYDNITLNSGLSDMMFNYEPPAHATVIDDFMSK